MFRTFCMLGDHSRKCLHMETDVSLLTRCAPCALDRVVEQRSKPKAIRFDNVFEFVSHVMQECVRDRSIRPEYTQLGKPQQNVYVERLNCTAHHEYLEVNEFATIEVA